MADALDILRQDALQRRIKGFAGGHRIAWSARDCARISDHVRTLPEKMLRDVVAAPTITRKLVDAASARRKLSSEQGIVVRAAQPGDLNFLFTISTARVDLANDSITPGGIDTRDFVRNPAVLNSHNSETAPIAISTTPFVSNAALMATAKFPQPGISEASDQIASAVGASLMRGASIGFIPGKWSFSKDPARHMGIDFTETKLLEWSICSVPCNPDCILVGAVASGKSARRNNTPAEDPYDDTDWQCTGSSTIPIDSSDDPYDGAASKAALLDRCSPNGTITDEARRYFLAVDVNAPTDPANYMFPFCRAVPGAGIIASKIGWRKSFAALENSNIPGLPIDEARSLVAALEARIGDAKMAALKREAIALVAKARLKLASMGEDVPLTRSERLAEVRNFLRAMERQK
jgi:hypothetical protein